MPVKSTPRTHSFIDTLRLDYPDVSFVEAGQFSWHAGKRHISYKPGQLQDVHATWALLHELGHALLDHTDFANDMELLQFEAAAWQKAHELARKYGLAIDEEYVQDSLDSYRDWLHIRATCPTCHSRSLQIEQHRYRCHNCGTEWLVSRSRLCRPYRKTRS